jgi:hypothetical protein
MPFTPAHPALLLPLLKLNPRYVSGTGLVAGAMSPDFEYFLKMSVESRFSHTVAGMFYFDLPVTFLLSVLFHSVVKFNLIGSMSAMLQSRFQQVLRFDFLSYVKKHPVAFACSALIGCASHIFWDSFTHAEGFFVTRLAFYEESYIPFDGVAYPLWYALQHISSFAGISAILIYIFLQKREPVREMIIIYRVKYAIIVLTIIGAVIGFRFFVKPSDYDPGNLVVTAISGFCIAVVVAGRLKLKVDTINDQ